MSLSSKHTLPQSSKSIDSLRQPIHRINFRVISCTSADNNNSAVELELQSPESRGWVSQRFCSYPQIITIQLIDFAIVQKLTFLSHQSKITTKIDIECKQKEIDMWKKLGYTCMQSNMTTNYEARQLRTVRLNKQLVQYFKFTLHPNYVNTINVFNQVALIAISIYGDRYHPKPLDDMKERGILPPGAILDKQTLDKLRELQYMKRDAIQNNDFEKASSLKQEIDKLKSGVQALAILQKQKKDAIRREDYEEAKKIYEKMKKIRGPIPRVVVSSNDRYDDDNPNKSMEYQRGSFTPIVSNIKKLKNKSVALDEDAPINNKESPILQLKKKNVLPQVIKPQKIINFDEIRVGPKSDRNIYQNAAYLDEQQRLYNQSLPQSPKVKSIQKKQQKFNRNKLSLDQKQLYRPQNKSKQHEIQDQQTQFSGKIPPECEQFFPVVSEMIFNNLFSGDKNLRQHGLDQTLKLVDKIQQEDYFQKLFINAVIFILKHVISDKIVSVLLKSVDLLGMMFKEYKPKPQQIQRQNQRNLKFILEKLSEYIGHPNEKLKNQVQDVYIVLPKYSKSTSKQLCIETITLNQKIDRAPRSIISKLQMLGKLIRKYDQHALKSNKSSMINDKKKEKYEEVIEYAKRFLQDRNSEVRTTAVKLLVYLGKMIGHNELLSSLDDVRETTKKLIEEKLLIKTNNQESEHKFVQKQQLRGLHQNESLKKSANNSPRLMSPKKSSTKDNKKVQSPQFNKNKPLPPWKKGPQKQSQSPQTINKQKLNQPQQPYKPRNPQYICEYCEQQDKRLENQTFRDIHLFKYCPLITICKQCDQCVEVEFLNQHLVQECQRKKFWKKCPRCKESVLGKLYNEHVEKKKCIAAKPLNVANRCPHCHEDIEPKKKGWIKHLIDEGCPCQRDRAK